MSYLCWLGTSLLGRGFFFSRWCKEWLRRRAALDKTGIQKPPETIMHNLNIKTTCRKDELQELRVPNAKQGESPNKQNGFNDKFIVWLWIPIWSWSKCLFHEFQEIFFKKIYSWLWYPFQVPNSFLLIFEHNFIKSNVEKLCMRWWS